MTLDPRAAQFLEQIRAAGLPPAHALPLAEARRQLTPPPEPRESVARVENRAISGFDGPLQARFYTPKNPVSTGAAGLPIVVFFHGGGFVQGDLETHDNMARMMAALSGCLTVAVDYRLAPENKYPAAVEDAFAATRWIADHAAEFGADPNKVFVSGDSAGGNLATVVCLMARDRGRPSIAGQILMYPVTNYAFDTPSYHQFATGYYLTQEAMRWFWTQYLSHEDEGRQPYASPLVADELYGMPPALILTAEYDPLRDEGEDYAERLREAGVEVTLQRIPGMIHGFARRPELFPQAREAFAAAASFIRGKL